MSEGGRPPRRHDADVVILDDSSGDDLAKVLAEAERAVEAVEERHRHADEGETHVAPVGSADPPPTRIEGSLEADPIPAAVVAAARIAELEGNLAKAQARAVQAEEEEGRVREALLRKAADFDNLKRRTEREKTDYFKFALAESFRDLIGVLDNFDRALAQPPGVASGEDFRVGIEMISRQLSEALKRYGLAEIPALGQAFDPNVHEAVVREETAAVAPGTVLDVLQKGYVLNDRLLRPALVKVAAAKPRPDGV